MKAIQQMFTNDDLAILSRALRTKLVYEEMKARGALECPTCHGSKIVTTQATLGPEAAVWYCSQCGVRGMLPIFEKGNPS